MAGRRNPKPKRRRPVARATTGSSSQEPWVAAFQDVQEALHANGVLLEQMRAQNHAVMEALQANAERQDRNIAEFRAELLARIEVLESIVRQNSEDIQKLEGKVDGLDRRLTLVEGRLTVVEDRLTGVENLLTLVEDRLAGVENRLTLVELSVEKLGGSAARLEDEIRDLKEGARHYSDKASLSAVEVRVSSLETRLLAKK